MSWWGTLLGGTFGYMLGGPLGAMLGAALGRNFDAKSQGAGGGFASDHERIQTAFFTATFSVMGHVAKADGRVSEDEIRLAKAVMDQMRLNSTLRTMAQNLFNEGKEDHFSLDEVLDQFKQVCHRRHSLLRVFIEILLQAAYADGVLHDAERSTLHHICDRLGFTRTEFNHLEAIIRASVSSSGRRGAVYDLNKAYEILNISPKASDAEVKKAYRRLMNQHHPDKLVAKGLPEEMMKLATDKTHEIRTAYEQIRNSRGS